MKVLFLSSEAAPLVKVGGLADVTSSLPKALRALGHDVRVAIPGYGAIDWAGLRPTWRTRFDVPYAFGPQTAEVFELSVAGVPFYLVCGSPIPTDHRVYGSGIDEDGEKFVFFSLAAVRLCRAIDWRPDLVHANDWHAGAAVYWLATAGRSEEFYRDTAALLTIHNLSYSGRGAGRALANHGLASSGPASALPEWARDSPLALGLVTADFLSTVSPTYAREILTPAYGEGLDGVLRLRADRLAGILNGIDPETWNPASDPAIVSRYDESLLSERAPNKRALQAELSLDPDDRAPLLGVVSRLDSQKGFEIAMGPVRKWLQEGGQFAILGTGNPAIERDMAVIERGFPRRAAVRLRFDVPLSRRIYAGADALLLPSRYEPCGLAQMIGMRYGAIPVARRTGGLADTVKDAGDPGGTGFVFGDYSSAALWDALARARRVYSQPEGWVELQRRGMRTDFSWERPAREYADLYQLSVASRRPAAGATRSG